MLIANWRAVLRHAWSIRLIALSTLFGALDVGLPYLNGILPVRPGTFAVLVVLVNIAATVARLVPQRRAGEVPVNDQYGDQP